MLSRTPSIEIGPHDATIREGSDRAPGCRLRAALIFRDPGDCSATGARVEAIACEGPDGRTLWGWPDKDGEIALRAGAEDPPLGCVLPLALALALALRDGLSSPGTRTLVVGAGFPGRLARAVASHLGCRVRSVDGPGQGPIGPEPGPDLVIETTGSRESLPWGLAMCNDYGTVCFLGAAVSQWPLDYYPDVHRRALTLLHVAPRPFLRPGDEAVIARGIHGLTRAVRGIAPEPEEFLDLRGIPAGETGQLGIEKASGWGLALVRSR